MAVEVWEQSHLGGPTNQTAFDTSVQYGQSTAGGDRGHLPASGQYREITLNFDGEGPLFNQDIVPLDARVVDVNTDNTTGTAVVLVGAQDVSLARLDDDTTWVTVTTAANVTVTGVTAGTVVVNYRYTAASN